MSWARPSPWDDSPSALTPTAHAASHQHGGSDPVATSTAGANAIPKADAAGKLSAAWGGSANTVATLDGAARVATSQLGSGLANNTKVLRGDQAWADFDYITPTATQNAGAPASGSTTPAGGTKYRLIYGTVQLIASGVSEAKWTIEVETGVATSAYDIVQVPRVAPGDTVEKDLSFSFAVLTGRRYRFTRGGAGGTTENITRYSYMDF